MLQPNYSFTLLQKAKNKGGDKYVCKTDPQFCVYFPQYISRDSSGITRKEVNLVVVSDQTCG